MPGKRDPCPFWLVLYSLCAQLPSLLGLSCSFHFRRWLVGLASVGSVRDEDREAARSTAMKILPTWTPDSIYMLGEFFLEILRHYLHTFGVQVVCTLPTNRSEQESRCIMQKVLSQLSIVACGSMDPASSQARKLVHGPFRDQRARSFEFHSTGAYKQTPIIEPNIMPSHTHPCNPKWGPNLGELIWA